MLVDLKLVNFLVYQEFTAVFTTDPEPTEALTTVKINGGYFCTF